jgi:hypothetical protein
MNEERTTEAREAAEGSELDQNMAALAERARDTIEQFVRDQPHAALGIAAAAGFILGGGLTPRRLLRIGLAAGGPALSRQIVDRVVRAASDFLDDEDRYPKRENKRPTT